MNAIYTIPKSGTNYLAKILEELQIDTPCFHFIENKPENDHFRKSHSKVFFRDPNPNEKKVLLIRDLRDVMVSAQFWIDTWLNKYDQSSSLEDHIFSTSAPNKQLLLCIQVTKCAKNHMGLTKAVLDLALKIIAQPNTLVIKFEDIIGENAGGSCKEEQRLQIIQNMCNFLGYKRSIKQIEQAIAKVWGTSITYNPVKNKVGRWKDTFTEEHIKAFKLYNWDYLNTQLGYSSIDNDISMISTEILSNVVF